MTTEIVKQGDIRIALTARAQEYLADSVADNTKRGYRSDMRKFSGWAESVGVDPLPATPSTVCRYFAHMASVGNRASTIDRAKAAIRMAHEAARLPDPTGDVEVRKVLKGIRRNIGTAKSRKAPTLATDIRAMVDGLPDGLIGTRDKALLLVGFAGAFRRSELVGIERSHIEETLEGVKILLPRSKTDQEGKGRYVGIVRGSNPLTCPVRALLTWLTAADIASGPIFRRVDRHGNIKEPLTAQTVALVVKRAAVSAGLDPAKYSGHSLRAGFVTQGAINGVAEVHLMRQTGHKSHDTVRGYVRIANLFKDNASGNLGL